MIVDLAINYDIIFKSSSSVNKFSGVAILSNIKSKLTESKKLTEYDIHSGQTEILSDLFNDYHQQVYRLAYRITLSHKDAEDIVQDVFLKLYYKLHQFEEKSKISTWIYRITLNTSIDSQRRFKKRKEEKPLQVLAETEMNIPMQNPNEHNVAEIAELLNRAITKLKQPFRTVLILRNFEDFTYEDIAEILNITSGTVASRLNRAYTKLKIELEKLGIDKQYLMNQ